MLNISCSGHGIPIRFRGYDLCICDKDWHSPWPAPPPGYDNCSVYFKTFILATNIALLIIMAPELLYCFYKLTMLTINEHRVTKKWLTPTIQKAIHLAVVGWLCTRYSYIAVVLSKVYETAAPWSMLLLFMHLVFFRDLLLLLFAYWWLGVILKLLIKSPLSQQKVWRAVTILFFTFICCYYAFYLAMFPIGPAIKPSDYPTIDTVQTLTHIVVISSALAVLVGSITYFIVTIVIHRLPGERFWRGRAKLFIGSISLVFVFCFFLFYDVVGYQFIDCCVVSPEILITNLIFAPFTYYFNWIFTLVTLIVLITCSHDPYSGIQGSTFSTDIERSRQDASTNSSATASTARTRET